MQSLVDDVGNKLANKSIAGDTPYRYEFYLLADDKTINAFALPGELERDDLGVLFMIKSGNDPLEMIKVM